MRTLIISLALLAIAGAASASQEAAPAKEAVPTAKTGDAQIIAQQLPSYPLDVCPVSHEGLDAMGKPMEYVHEGRLVRFCCKSCLKEFKKDPTPILKQIDDAVVKTQMASYPLTKCPVGGEDLKSMGTPFDYVHGTRLVRFCCKDCVAEFQKDPAKYMATIDQALIEAQKKSYPVTTCVVSGKPLEATAVDHLYGTQLVRFCCPDCIAGFQAEPAKYLVKLGAPAKKAAEPAKGH